MCVRVCVCVYVCICAYVHMCDVRALGGSKKWTKYERSQRGGPLSARRDWSQILLAVITSSRLYSEVSSDEYVQKYLCQQDSSHSGLLNHPC